MNAYYEINEGAEPWAKTVSSLNALIEQYNLVINKRKGAIQMRLPKHLNS